MQQFIYQVPNLVHVSTKLPIKDERGKTIFLLQKQPHKLLASILNASLRFGIPYSYKVTTANGKTLYSIDCLLPGIGYKIIDHLSSKTVSISSRRVQLIEKAYSFNISNHDFYFEKDYTGTGRLKCEDKVIAIVSMPSSVNVSMVDTIKIVSETEEMASLSAVLFHTLYYYDA